MTQAPSFLSEITGSFALRAAQNPTVVMIEAAYRHAGLDVRYLNCEVTPESLADAVRGARAMGWLGFNCSLPHKVAVVPLLDALGDSAEIIGAVNCVVRRGDRLVGENTDGRGFLNSLRTIVDPAHRSVVVLGAGGAARAIAVEAALAGAASITVVNRDATRGEALVRLLRERTSAVADLTTWQGRYRVPSDADILVNATSVGMSPDVDAVPAVELGTLRRGMVVCDVVANPPLTRLLIEATTRGCVTLDGLGMLVNQGVVAVEHWTGVTPDSAVMRAVLAGVFGSSAGGSSPAAIGI